jgi:hypothetical protein
MFDPGKSGMGQHSKCPDHLATKKIAARKAKTSILRGSRVNAGGVMLTFWRSWARRVRRKSHSKILKTINMIAINPSKRITLKSSSLINFSKPSRFNKADKVLVPPVKCHNSQLVISAEFCVSIEQVEVFLRGN